MQSLNEKFLCKFSIPKLTEMSEKAGTKEMFKTFGGRNLMNIYEITKDEKIVMRRSTGKLTWELDMKALIHVHNLVHSGEIDIDPHEIDKLRIKGKLKTTTWGNYIAGLLKHLGCQR